MNKIFFAKSINGSIPRGSLLFENSEEGLEPIVLQDHETESILGKSYLLIEQEPQEFLAQVPTGAGYNFYFRKSGITYRYDEAGTLLETSSQWVKVGSFSNKGKVVEVTENLALVEDPAGKRTNYLKKSLLPATPPKAIYEQQLEALEYSTRLRKAIAQAPAPPKVQQPPKMKISFAGKQAQAVPAQPQQEHHEGETKNFGLNDLRKLSITSGGKRRWINADEQQALQKQKEQNEKRESENKGEAQKHTEGSKNVLTNLFRVGKEIFVGGQKAKIVAHATDVLAVKKGDGSTATVRASEYNEEHHRPKEVQPETPQEAPEKTAEKETAVRQQQEALNYDVSGEATYQNYYKEHQQIINEQRQTPEYQKFESEMKSLGWTADNATPFHYVHDITHINPEGIAYAGTLERIWRPEKRDFDTYFESQAFDVTYQGKPYKVSNIERDDYTLKGEDGAEVKIKSHELDDYQGMIQLDEDGRAFVQTKAGKPKGELQFDEGITQKELFAEGTIKIIRNEVWKSIKDGSGARVDDIRLGKLRSGIALYKHGNELGIVDGNFVQFHPTQAETRRDVPELDESLKNVKKVIDPLRKQIDNESLQRQDLEIVKARIEHGSQTVPYKTPTKAVDVQNYTDVFDQWLKDGGAGIQDQVANSYYNKDEWNANVLSVAERMKAEDVKRRDEVEALNAIASSGVMKAVPPDKPIDDYIEASREMLRTKRRDVLQEQTQKKVAAGREEGTTQQFDWDTQADLPQEETGAVLSDQVKTIFDSRNDKYQVQYAFVPQQNVVQSHEATGQRNPDHPAELQARSRDKDISSTVQMQNIAKNPNEDLVADNNDATRGAPVAFHKDGKTYIVQGNARTGGVKAMEGESKQKYFGMMLQRARELGLPTDKITPDMMMVRYLSPIHTYEDARKLGAFGQESSSLPLTEVERARGIQNAQRTPLASNVNMQGIGRRAITEKNVSTFIHNNPELYKKIVSSSGYDTQSIMNRPNLQSQVVNTALLAQLNKEFINTVASKGEDTHELVKVIAPIMADNQRDVAEGTVPENADIQRLLKNTIGMYDTLNSASRNMMHIDKDGNIPFIATDDQAHANPDTLVSRMRQEHLQFGDQQEHNEFRNPLSIIGLMAYHQAINPKNPEKKAEAREQFALKVRRFADALKTIKAKKAEGADLFGATMNAEELQGQEKQDIIKIAERVFLENKPYTAEEASELTPEEQAASAEQHGTFNVHNRMNDIAKKYSFALKKSFRTFYRTPALQRQQQEADEFRKSLYGGAGAPQPKEGDVKQFGASDRRRFSQAVGRWIDDDTYQKINKYKLSPKPQPKDVQHSQRTELQHSLELKKQDTTFSQGTFVFGDALLPEQIIEVGEELVVTKDPHGKERTRAKNDLKKYVQEEITPEQAQAMINDWGATLPKSEIEKIADYIPPALIRHIAQQETSQRYTDELGYYTPERQALHQKFVDDRTQGIEENIPKGKKHAIILAGGGGAGKTSIARMLFGDSERQKTHVWADPDIAKECLPEFKLGNVKRFQKIAGVVHEESSHLNKLVVSTAIRKGQNLLMDGTLSDPEKAKKIYKMLKDEGYKIDIVHVDASVDVAHKRSLKRAAVTGRFVNKAYLKEANENSPRSTFELMKESDETDRVFFVNNNGESAPHVYLAKDYKGVRVHDQAYWKTVAKKGKIDEDPRTITSRPRRATGDNPASPTSRELISTGGRTGRESERPSSQLSIFEERNQYELPPEIKRPKFRAVAFRIDDKVYEAPSGMHTHGDLLRENSKLHEAFKAGGEGDKGYSGFVDQDGKFYTRAEAKAATGIYGESASMRYMGLLKSLFKSQMDLFNPNKGWKSAGQEKPQHQYKRRERTATGWKYFYTNAQGQEYEADEKGKPMPAGHDWEEGDTVYHKQEKHFLKKKGDALAVVANSSGEEKTVRTGELQHERDQQRELVEHVHENKWEKLVAALKADLQQGEESKAYEHADNKGELQRKIKYAEEERDKRKLKPADVTETPVEKDITKSLYGQAVKDFWKKLLTARKRIDRNPSEAQKEAGNYKKGHVMVHGLDIAIENPKGGYRSGTDPYGKKWRVKMNNDYGYFKTTEGKDEDPIDVFLGDKPKSENVFIVNQLNPKTQKFDEHKTMFLFDDEREAIKAYKSHYLPDANKYIESVVSMPLEIFKEWLETGDHKREARTNNAEEVIVMKKKDVVEEHKELVNDLRKKDPFNLNKQLRRQARELKEYKEK